MSATVHSNARYISGALIIHALIAAVFIVATLYSPNIVVPQLGIKGMLVDSSSLSAPKPRIDPQEQERIEQQKRDQQKKEQEQLEQQQKEKQEQLHAEEQEKEKQAELKRVADAQQEAKQQKLEAEKKRVEEIKQKQHDIEQKRQADADAKAQAKREADLKAQLADEDERNQAINSGALAQWQAQVVAKITMNWRKPLSVSTRTDCDVSVVQSPGGNVIRAQVTRCNGDMAVKESIETAVLDASPLPLPSDMHVFTRSFTVHFNPKE